MANRLYTTLQKLTNGWTIIFLCIFMFSMELIIGYPGTRSPILVSGPIFPYALSRPVDFITDVAIPMYEKVFNNEGLQHYIQGAMIFDITAPIFRAIFFFFFVAYTLSKLPQIKHRFLISLIIPVFTISIKYLAIIGIVVLLKNYPKRMTDVAKIVQGLLVTEQILLSLAFWFIVICLVFLYIKFMVDIIKKKPSAS